MSWQLSLAVRGDLGRYQEAEAKALAEARTAVVRRRAGVAQRFLRKQIAAAGGAMEKLVKTVRVRNEPARTVTPDPKSVVYSRSLVKNRVSGKVDVLTLLDHAQTIRPLDHRGGAFLLIPLNAHGVTRRQNPLKNPERYQVIIARDKKSGVIVERAPKGSRREAEGRKVVLWILVRQVHLKKRIDTATAHARALKGIEEQIDREWTRRAERIAARLRRAG